MSIFNEYLTGYERELAIEESAFDTEFSKLQTMYEMTNLQLAQMHKDAELKVLTESGTYDDLTYLISEAEAEVGEQKKGILARIIDLIGKLFAAIGSKLSSLVNKGNENAIVEAPADTVEKANVITNAIDSIRGGFDKLSRGEWSGALDILNGAKGPAMAAAAGFGTHAVLKKWKKGELDGIIAKLNAAFEKLKSLFNSLKTKLFGDKAGDEDNKNKGFNIIREIGNYVNTFIGKLKKYIGDAIAKVTGKADDATEEPAKPEEKGNPVLSTNFNGKPHRLFANGEWETRDPATKKWVKVENPAPALVTMAENRLKQESTVEEVQAVLGDAYIVEKTEEGFIITESTNSASSSIFGQNLENDEMLQESADAFDEELDELARLFEGL